MSRTPAVLSLPRALPLALVVAAVLPGCQAPFHRTDPDDKGLGPAVTTALEREIAQLPADAKVPLANEGPTTVESTLAARRDELDKLGPQWTTGFKGLNLGPTLDDLPQREVQISLKTAIQRAVRNNIAVQTAKIDQGISDARLAQAEAVFDATLYANTGFDRATQPEVGVVLPGGSVLNNLRDSRDWVFTTGLQKPLVTGGRIELSTSMDYGSRSPDGLYSPDPAWANSVSLGLSQPLMRGFGTDVNMAQIRLAQNQDRSQQQALRGSLLDTVSSVEAAYWRLALARQTLVSANWLVEVGVEVRDVLARRREFDATVAQYANAVATVEQRKAQVIQAQRLVQEANNALKALMNDPDFPVGGELNLVPVDLPTETAIAQDLRSAIVTAAEKSPTVIQALLRIDDASIGVLVADNGRLPQLDLDGKLSWFGLDGSWGDSYEQVGSGDFVEYIVGATFSQAIGNRAAEAKYREARLLRSRSVLSYRASIQQAVLEVKNALQSVKTNFDLIRQNRAFRVAQAENLRALLVSEKTLAALTPEFLQLKFQEQDALARAQTQLVASMVDYNIAISSLHRAMGTGLEMNQIEIEIVDPESGSQRVASTSSK